MNDHSHGEGREQAQRKAQGPSQALGHTHTHAARGDDRRRLGLVFAITTTILAVEVVGAVVSGSLALMADAGHMLTDAAGLVIALIATSLALRPETDTRTWGYRRAEVPAATVQAAVLLAVGVFVLVEGVRRLLEPPQVVSGAMVVFGIVGLVGNLLSMLVLTLGRSGTFNMRAAVLEVANDALGSVAVLLAATVIALTGWQRADALVRRLSTWMRHEVVGFSESCRRCRPPVSRRLVAC